MSAECQDRHCPIHCSWESWQQWSPSKCPVTCGSATQVRTRAVAVKEAHGGIPCDDPDLISLQRVCESTPCPIDCEYHEWGLWSSCTLTCGTGVQSRARLKIHSTENAGANCPGTHRVHRDCNIVACPIDCEVSEFGGWAACTEDCGGGESVRERNVLIKSQHGGEPCPFMKESKACNEDACDLVEAIASPMSKVSFLGSLLVITLTICHTEAGT